MRSHLIFALLIASSGACKNSESSAAHAPMSVKATVPPNTPPDEDEMIKGPHPIDTVREKMRQVDTTKPDYDDPNFKPPTTTTSAKDTVKGDQEDSEWTPAEYKQGQSRWKDPGVYVDGKPIGFLQFGELPIGIPVVWRESEKSINKAAGSTGPDRIMGHERVYRFIDYLRLMGVDPATIKELHVYGPRITNSLIVTGKELMSEKGQKFYFRFGSNVGGKPIPATPGRIGNGIVPDKMASLMVYVNKKPPTLDTDEGMILDGRPQLGVPYFGEPIRGGVRVYVDNKLGGIIKRQDLDVKLATKDPDGTLRWKLADVLAKLGVDTKKSVELWVIRSELRQERLEDFASLTFAASSQAHGGLLLGDKNIRANALAFHSRHLKPEELPKVTPDDE